MAGRVWVGRPGGGTACERWRLQSHAPAAPRRVPAGRKHAAAPHFHPARTPQEMLYTLYVPADDDEEGAVPAGTAAAAKADRRRGERQGLLAAADANGRGPAATAVEDGFDVEVSHAR